MIKPFRTEDPQLEATLAQCYSHLATLSPSDETYAKTMTQITELNALKNKGLDPNTLLIAAANLVVGYGVLKYERTGVVSTKIFSFLQKL